MATLAKDGWLDETAGYNILYMLGKLLKCMITYYSSEITCTTAPWAFRYKHAFKHGSCIAYVRQQILHSK